MMLTLPAAVGVPEIVPVEVLKIRPDGSAPETIDHVYGTAPFEALSVAL